MYQPSTPPIVTPHSGRNALIYGVLAGLGLGIVESAIIVYVAHSMYYSPYAALSIPFSLLLWIIIFMIAGAVAGKRTGKIVTGTLAGLWAGMVGGIITAVTFFATIMPSYYGYGSVGAIATYLTFTILLILGALGVGTGLGALGGLIGQSFSTHTQPAIGRYPQSDPHQYYQTPLRQSDPPQQEQEQVQYQQSHFPQQEQQG